MRIFFVPHLEYLVYHNAQYEGRCKESNNFQRNYAYLAGRVFQAEDEGEYHYADDIIYYGG